MTAANSLGEKFPMFITGESKTPQCFKYVKHLPCQYQNQKKSWMTIGLF